MKNGKVSGGWRSEKKRVRKRMEERENGGYGRGSNSLGGRRQALLR